MDVHHRGETGGRPGKPHRKMTYRKMTCGYLTGRRDRSLSWARSALSGPIGSFRCESARNQTRVVPGSCSNGLFEHEAQRRRQGSAANRNVVTVEGMQANRLSRRSSCASRRPNRGCAWPVVNIVRASYHPSSIARSSRIRRQSSQIAPTCLEGQSPGTPDGKLKDLGVRTTKRVPPVRTSRHTLCGSSAYLLRLANCPATPECATNALVQLGLLVREQPLDDAPLLVIEWSPQQRAEMRDVQHRYLGTTCEPVAHATDLGIFKWRDEWQARSARPMPVRHSLGSCRPSPQDCRTRRQLASDDRAPLDSDTARLLAAIARLSPSSNLRYRLDVV